MIRRLRKYVWPFPWPTRIPIPLPEREFFDWILAQAKKGAMQVVEKALIAYFVMMDPKVPKWARGVVGGALLYFISPVP